jgi:hypothetical protein
MLVNCRLCVYDTPQVQNGKATVKGGNSVTNGFCLRRRLRGNDHQGIKGRDAGGG